MSILFILVCDHFRVDSVSVFATIVITITCVHLAVSTRQGSFLSENGLRARDTDPTTDCTIVIDSVERRHSGNYTCSPFVGGQVDAPPAEVIVAGEGAAAGVDVRGDGTGGDGRDVSIVGS